MVTIRTKDLDEAAYLWCEDTAEFKGVQQEANRNGRGKTVFFLFEMDMSDEEVTELRRAYYNRKARVEPKLHAQRLVDVRNVLHESFQGNRR